MAAVIREGGKSPISIRNWRDKVKLCILEEMYNSGQLNKQRAYGEIYRELNRCKPDPNDERLSSESLESILSEMLVDGWIEVHKFVCECCSKQAIETKDLIHHATDFRLTKAGYNKIPEHIFP